MGYFEFVTLLTRSAFVITDGGSNQEELSYLDKPTLLMREATERQEGLGRNAVLSGYDFDKVRAFVDGLKCPEKIAISLPEGSPSAFVADALAAYS